MRRTRSIIRLWMKNRLSLFHKRINPLAAIRRLKAFQLLLHFLIQGLLQLQLLAPKQGTLDCSDRHRWGIHNPLREFPCLFFQLIGRHHFIYNPQPQRFLRRTCWASHASGSAGSGPDLPALVDEMHVEPVDAAYLVVERVEVALLRAPVEPSTQYVHSSRNQPTSVPSSHPTPSTVGGQRVVRSRLVRSSMSSSAIRITKSRWPRPRLRLARVPHARSDSDPGSRRRTDGSPPRSR